MKNNKSIPQLLKTLERYFNKFIRERDSGQPCINCDKYRTLEAGHYFPKTFSAVRFDERNVNGECHHCNYYDSQSHSYGYRKNLIKKIGQEEFDKLELKSKMRHKWDRYTLIVMIDEYKLKLKK